MRFSRVVVALVAALGLLAPVLPARAAEGDLVITVVDDLTGDPVTASGTAYLYRDGEPIETSPGSYVYAPLSSGTIRFSAAQVGSDRENLSITVEFSGSASGQLFKNLMYEPLTSEATQTVEASPWLGSVRIVTRSGATDDPAAYRPVSFVDRATRQWNELSDSYMLQTDAYGRVGFDLPIGRYMMGVGGARIGFGQSLRTYPLALIPVEVAEVEGAQVLLDDEGRVITTIRLRPSEVELPAISDGAEVEDGRTPVQYRGGTLLYSDESGVLSALGSARAEWTWSGSELVVHHLESEARYQIDGTYIGLDLRNAAVAVSDDATTVATLAEADGGVHLVTWDLDACEASVLSPSCEVAAATSADLWADLAIADGDPLSLGLTASSDLSVVQATVTVGDPFLPRGMSVVVHPGGSTSTGVLVGGAAAGDRASCGSVRGGAVSADGGTAVVAAADAACRGQLYAWLAEAPEEFTTQITPVESVFGSGVPNYPVLSADGTMVAVRAAVPGVASAAENVVVLATREAGASRVVLVNRISGDLGGAVSIEPLAVDTSGRVTVWIDSWERSDEYGLVPFGSDLLEFDPAQYGQALVELVTGDDAGEALPTPVVSVSGTQIEGSTELRLGTQVTVAARSVGATSMTGTLQCTGCSGPIALTFQSTGGGQFTSTATLPAGAERIDSISAQASAEGFRPSSGQASGLPLAIASRYRITLTGMGVGANASDQVRTARLVATRNDAATTYRSAVIGTSTSVAFDVPSNVTGVRLVAANNEVLGAITLAARPGAEVTGTVTVRQRVGLRILVPQAVKPASGPAPFAFGDILITVTAPDGTVIGQFRVTEEGVADVGRVPAGVAYSISAEVLTGAIGPGVSEWMSASPSTFTPSAGGANDARTATVNLRALESGPVTFNAYTRRVISGTEGTPQALGSALVVLSGRQRPDGLRLSKVWQGTTDASGALTLAGVPAGTYNVRISNGRNYLSEDLEIPAPGSRATVRLDAVNQDPVEVPVRIEVGTRPDEVSLLRAEWRNLAHYGFRGGSQVLPADPGDTTKSGTMVLQPGQHEICADGREANIMVAPCVRFEVDIDGNVVILGAGGQRTPGTPTLRVVPAAALEVVGITGLGANALRGATFSVDDGSPVALLPWKVAPSAAAAGFPAAPGLIPVPTVGEVTVRLYSSDGRESSTTVTVADGEVKTITPVFVSDSDIVGSDSRVVVAAGLVVPGVATPVRYRVQARTPLTAATLTVELPPGLAVRDRSVVVDGEPATSTTTIPLGTIPAGGVRNVSLLVDSSGSVSGAQLIGGTVRSGTKSSALPVAILTYGSVTLDSPGSTRSRTIIVSGRAAPQVQVEIRDNATGTPLAMASTSSTGTYQVSVELPAVAVVTDFTLVARVVGSDPEVVSAGRTVTYDPSGVQITSVTLRQVNPADAKDTRSLTGDPRNGVMRAPFVWVPGHVPSVSFTVDDPSRVRRAVVFLGTTSALAVRQGGTFTATFPTTIDAGPVDIRLDVSAPRANQWTGATEGSIIAALPPAMRTPSIRSELTDTGTRGQIRWRSPDGTISVLDMQLSLRRAPAGATVGVVTFPVSPYEDGSKESRSTYPELVVNIPLTGDPFASTRSGQGRSLASTVWQATVRLVKGKSNTIGGAYTFDGYIPDDYVGSTGFAFLSLDGLAGAVTSDGLSKDIMSFTDEVTQYCADYPEIQTRLMQKVERLIDLARWGTHWYGPLYSIITLPIADPVLGVAAGAVGSYFGKQYDAALRERLGLLESDLNLCKQLRRQQQRWDDEHEAIRRLLDGEPAGGVVAAPVFIYDPSGYVYEAVRSNRIPGALATLYDYTDVVPGRDPIKWDAVPYGQVNDLITNGIGRYGWDVPPGLWRVTITKAGYKTAYSDIVEVLPPQLEVDIGLVSTRAPKISSVTYARDGTVRITFSQYMTVESMKRAVAATASARVKGKKGMTTVRFSFGESAGEGKGKGLKVDPYAPIARGGKLPFVSTSLVLRPNRKMPKGTTIRVTIARGAVAYTGTVLGAQKSRVITVKS